MSKDEEERYFTLKPIMSVCKSLAEELKTNPAALQDVDANVERIAEAQDKEQWVRPTPTYSETAVHDLLRMCRDMGQVALTLLTNERAIVANLRTLQSGRQDDAGGVVALYSVQFEPK